MTSRLTWLWETGPRPPLAIVGNLYFWFSLALFAWTPVVDRAPAGEERQPAEAASTG